MHVHTCMQMHVQMCTQVCTHARALAAERKETETQGEREREGERERGRDSERCWKCQLTQMRELASGSGRDCK